jgi:IS5 family transposase
MIKQLVREHDRLPDESTILRFRHVLEKHKLAERILATVNLLLGAKGLMLRSGRVVDATLISAPSSTKNAGGERDPEMHQSKKGQQWHFGMKVHIGVVRPGTHQAHQMDDRLAAPRVNAAPASTALAHVLHAHHT